MSFLLYWSLLQSHKHYSSTCLSSEANPSDSENRHLQKGGALQTKVYFISGLEVALR